MSLFNSEIDGNEDLQYLLLNMPCGSCKGESKPVSSDDKFYAWFKCLAEVLLSHTHLLVEDRKLNRVFRYRILEIEFYCHTNNEDVTDELRHEDPFSHKKCIQLNTSGYWYFLTAGSHEDSYRGGNYKGINLTFGPFESETVTGRKGIYGGILIRSISRISTETIDAEKEYQLRKEDIIEGPSKCVDAILNASGYSSILALVNEHRGMNFEKHMNALSPRSVIRLGSISDTKSPQYSSAIYSSPRIGLPFRDLFEESRFRYIFRPYRFVPEDFLPFLVKGKSTFLCSLLVHYELDETKIRQILNISENKLSEWQGYFKGPEGRSKRKKLSHEENAVSRMSFPKDPTTKQVLKIYGEWTSNYFTFLH
jgi:hypothetical protein